MAEVAAAMPPLLNGDKVKKHSKHHDDPTRSKSKKRHRDSNNTQEASERKHKRSKSDAPAVVVEAEHDQPEPEQKHKNKKKSSKADPEAGVANGHAEDEVQEPEKKKKKKKSRHDRLPEPEIEQTVTPPQEHVPQEETIEEPTIEEAPKKKKDKKSKEDRKSKKEKKEKKSRRHAEQAEPAVPDAMDVDSTPNNTSTAAVDELADHDYPFFTQTVAQYLPLLPSGIIEPVHGYTDQHLKPLLNRYVPSFGGVLLAYRNPRLGEAPGRGSLTMDSDMDDTAVLESINEYAVTYGWLTVEVDLFRPARGAWLEGAVNLQGGGHIGVVCWGKFNASIEAERLPKGWKWIDLLPKGKKKEVPAPETTEVDDDEAEGEGEHPEEEGAEPEIEAEADSSQVHIAGYWVDENRKRIKTGTKLCFRIKNYEVGVSGDYGYLSIEGTMLSVEDEEKKVREEMERARRRKLRQGGGMLRGAQRRLPEYSMTKFGQDEVEENELQRVEIVQPPPGGDETDP